VSRYFKQEVNFIYFKYNTFHIEYWLVLLWLGLAAGWCCYYMHVQVHFVIMQPLVSWQRDRKWGLGAVCTSSITCTKTLILDALVCTSHTLQTSGIYSCGADLVAKHRSEVVNIGGMVYRSFSPVRGNVFFFGSGSNSVHSSPRGSKTFFL